MDSPDALDITSDISSDSDFEASSIDSDDTHSWATNASPDASNHHGSSSSEDEEEDSNESYEWLPTEELYQPGQASGIVIASPNELDINLEVLGDTVRNGEIVTRYFIRIEERKYDGNGREE